MRSSLLGVLAVVGGPFVAACSAPLASPTSADSSWLGDAAEGASSAALIVVERTVTADETAHGSAVARFVRMRSGSVDEQTLRMVGATLDLPTLRTCGASAASTTDEGDVEVRGPRAVELLDVGSLAVEANGVRTALEARALPDIVDLVTGVLYSTRTATLEPGALGHGAYVIQSTGSAVADGERSVPAFSVSAAAPGEPEELRIEGQDARASEGVMLASGSRVDLAWSVSDASDPDDLVYVEVIPTDNPPTSATSSGAAGTVRCLFADRGLASIPASAFGARESGASELTRGTLVVHRVHRESFQVAGRSGAAIDSGVIRFDFARAAEFTRR